MQFVVFLCDVIPNRLLPKFSVYIEYNKILYYSVLFSSIPLSSSYILFIFRAISNEWVTTTRAVPIS